jgi:ABC-2 type transport system permease protein
MYVKLQVLHTRAHLEYEADFWVGVLAMFLRYGAGIAFIWVLFSRVAEVGGWSQWEMLFLYALLLIPRGSVEVLANGQYRLGELVHGGEMDRLLLGASCGYGVRDGLWGGVPRCAGRGGAGVAARLDAAPAAVRGDAARTTGQTRRTGWSGRPNARDRRRDGARAGAGGALN